MIFKGDKEVTSIYKGNKKVVAVYKGNSLVWRAFKPPYIKGTADGNFTLYINYRDKNYQYKDINVTVSNGEFKEYLPEPYVGEQISLGEMIAETLEVTSVEFGDFDRVKVYDIGGFAILSEGLQTADISGLGKCEVKNLNYTFNMCPNLETVKMSHFKFGAEATMKCTFNYSAEEYDGIPSKLETIDFTGTDFSNVTTFEYCFYGCEALTTIIGPVTGIKENINFFDCPLTKESVMVIINGLATVNSTKTLTIKRSIYLQLSSADKAIASSKGWTIVPMF